MNATAETQIPNQCPEATELHMRINAIADMIPEDFENKEDVVKQLIDRRGSIPYTAPEIIGKRWNEIGVILSNHLPDPESESWAKDIAELFGTPMG